MTQNVNLKALDLFCGQGGVSVGLFNAGFDVTGVDVLEKKGYPFEFIQKSVFDLDLDFLKSFDFITASPPCQGYIFTNRNKDGYLRLIEPVRELLEKTGKPFVIENVPGAPIRQDLMLCGEMFGLKTLRHRFFEIHGFHVPQLKHVKHKGLAIKGDYIGCYSGAKGNPRSRAKYGRHEPKLKEKQKALQIFWMQGEDALHNAIPPKYYEYIGKQFLKPKLSLEVFN